MFRNWLKPNWIIIWVIALSRPLWGGEELPEIQQMTTHPQLDFSPSISPDGKWMAFTSERSGNLDVWIKALPRGRTIQITNHQSEDFQPVWSPDGRKIAFVSKRRDAQGDLWFIHIHPKKGIPKGKPLQLTHHLGVDRKPSFSPDGRRVVFVSDRDGIWNLFIFDLESHRETQLTIKGGTDPAWSPTGQWILFTSYRDDPGGDLFLIDPDFNDPFQQENPIIALTQNNTLEGQGCWSPDGNEVAFLRIERDTNHDGKITPYDYGSIWRIKIHQINDGLKRPLNTDWQELQVTTNFYKDSEPTWSSDHEIYFTSERGDGLDVWSIPESGILSRKFSAMEQYISALDRFDEIVSREALYHAVIGYHRVKDYFPEDSVMVAKSLIRCGEISQFLMDYDLSEIYYQLVISNYSDMRKEAARAELKIVSLPHIPTKSRIQRCLKIIESYPEQEAVVAEAWINLGDLYYEIGESGQSLSAYTQVIRRYSHLRNWIALAQIKIGDFFYISGQYETAQESYYAVLREFGNVPLWRNRASEKLMVQVKGTLEEKIQGYRQIIQEAVDFPSLMAEAQLAIGQNLYEEKKYEESIRELERVETLVPTLYWAHAKAMLLRAQIYHDLEDEQKSSFLLMEVIKTFRSVEGGVYATEANQKLFHIYMQNGKRLIASGNFVGAVARLEKAMKIRSDDIRVHRDWVKAMYSIGKIDTVIRHYQNDLKRNPSDPVLLYGIGLAYSFLAEEDHTLMEKSNAFLEQAMAEDYRLTYPYMTLSYNYELMEKVRVKREMEGIGLTKRVGRILSAPVKWMFSLLPFSKEGKKTEYYEKAIDVLTTALELNDETKNPSLEANLAQNLANNFYNLGSFGYKQAYQYYLRRIELDTTFVSPLQEAIIYEQMGRCGAYVEDYSQAEEFLQRALYLFEDLKQKEAAIRIRDRLAWLFQLNKQWERAVPYYHQIVSWNERMGRWDNVERAYRNIAFCYHMMSEPEDAIKYAKKAEKVIEREKYQIKPTRMSYPRVGIFGLTVKVPIFGIRPIGAASSEGLSKAEKATLIFGLISKNSEMLKDYYQAVQYEKKCFNIFHKRKEDLLTRISTTRIGVLYFKMREYQSAWDYFYQAWDASQKAQDEHGRFVNVINLSNVAIVELSLLKKSNHTQLVRSIIQSEIEEIRSQKNTDYHEKLILLSGLSTIETLQLMEQKEAVKSDQTRSISKTYQHIEAQDQVRKTVEEALSIAREEGFWKEEGILLKNLAEIFELGGDLYDAYRKLQFSEQIFREQAEEEYIWRVQYKMANILHQLSINKIDTVWEYPNPLELYHQAIQLLERLPVYEEGSEERLSDQFDRKNIYIDVALALSERNRYREALEMVERGREKAVADLLAKRPPLLKRERHKALWGNLRFLRSQLKEIRKKTLKEEAGLKRRYFLSKLEEEKTRVEEEYQEVLDKIREEDRVLAYLSGTEPINLDGVTSLFNHEKGALCYLVGSNWTFFWTVDRDTVQFYRLPIGENMLNLLIHGFLQSVQTDSSAEEKSQRLYSILLKPVEDFIQEKSSIIIVPDNVLWDLPFGMLSDGKLLFMEKVSISYSTSLTTYRLAFEKRKINQEKRVILGNVQDLSLLESMKESSPNSEGFFGEKGHEGVFRDIASSADIIQLEQWIIPDYNNALLSACVLFPGAEEDGFLRVEELFGYDMKPSLFWLPSVRTTDLKSWESKQLFILGLLYGGTPSILVKMWPVNQEITKLLMHHFYRNINTVSFSDGLADALLEVKKQFSKPLDWAGFQLYGFEGMNSDERLQFAKSNLVRTVLEGRSYQKIEEYEDAVIWFEKALNMAKTIEDTIAVQNLYHEIIMTANRGGLWEKAIQYQKKLVSSAREKKSVEAVLTGIKNLAHFYFQNQMFDTAAVYQDQLIQLLQNRSDPKAVGLGYERLASIFAANRHYQEAAQLANQAYQIYLSLEDPLSQARARIWEGRFYFDGEDYWKSRESFHHGISILTDIVNRGSANQNVLFNLATGYQLIGLSDEKLMLYQDALNDQKKGLELYIQLNQMKQEAQGYQYIANIYWKMGDYQNALQYQKRALKSFESLNDKKLLIMGYNTLGLIYMSMGDLTQAVEEEEKALVIAEKTEHMEDQATILKNIGMITLQQGEFEEALLLFKRATFIDSTIGLKAGLASDYRHMGNLLIHLNRKREGISILKTGLELSTNIGDRRNLIQCYYGLGIAYYNIHEYKEALAVLDSGLVIAQYLIAPDIEWRLYRKKANIFSRLGKHIETMQAYQKAVDIVEKKRAELNVESFQQGFFDNEYDLYSDVITYLIEQGKFVEAFSFVERARSRNFIDLIANQKLNVSTEKARLIEEEKKARLTLHEAEMRLASLLRKEDSLDETEELNRYTLKQELRSSQNDYNTLLRDIHQKNPELASFFSVDPLKFNKIQQLLSQNAILIEYFITEQSILIWVVKSDNVFFKQVKIARRTLEEMVWRYRQAIQAQLSVDRESSMLYRWLIQPVETVIQGVDHLIFVPHSILHYLPFAPLQDSEGHFLIERYTLSIVPSATVLGYCIEKGKPIPREKDQIQVLALGNPDLGNPRYHLEFAEREITAIERVYKNTRALIGHEATEDVVYQMAGNQNILHFACHATYEPDSPLYSALLLSPQDTQDGRLEAREIFGLDLNCDLVTLSACESGLGKLTQGGEIIGLTRSFIFAGTPSIVTSLWKVDDLATAVLIKRFYRYLGDGHSRADALRKAQLLVKEMVNGHPAFWAPFTLTGDFR